jgi:voltage-gated potassium channel Kch
MLYYLIICRSLTYAQRTARALEKAGISGYVVRAPKSVAGEGCSHGVKVAETRLAQALQVLGKEGLTPKRVYMQDGSGVYQEVMP